MQNEIVAHNDLKVRIDKDFFTSNESNILLKKLIANLPWESMMIKMFGKNTKIPRLQCWIGDEKELGPNPTIVSISFGSERDLVFRNKINKETLSIPQTNGCLILIDGKTQKNWQHSIKKTQKIIGPRINLTFRNIIITK